jgi:hypothetical protein
VGKPEEKTLGRPKCRREYIKMFIERCDEVVWTGLIWLRTETSGGLL